MATDNGLLSIKKNISKKIYNIKLHLQGQTIKSIDIVDAATYIGSNRKN